MDFEKSLENPTVGEMIEFLKGFDPKKPFRIQDPDTGWTIWKITYDQDEDAVWLSGDYRDM